MIDVSQLLTGLVMGTILLVMGLVPGLLDKWADSVSDLAGALYYRLHGIPVRRAERSSFGDQKWVAALGMALIALSLFLFVWR